MKEKLQKEITGTFNHLDTALASFTSSQLNAIPYEGSWTAGQVAEHILKSATGFPKLCDSAKEKAGRPADEKTAGIKKLFLDMTIKMQSPEFILPSAGPHDKGRILADLQAIEKEISGAVATHDPSLLCEAGEMPGFGKLTIYEWADFMMTHAQRHTRQIEKIFKTLS